MAILPKLRIALVGIAVGVGIAASGCGGSSSGATASSASTEALRLRDAVVSGLKRDFAAGTGVGGPKFESCLEGRLGKALDRPTLTRLTQVYGRPDGQAYAAQALNILAGPLAARCGHRHFVPEMVDAAAGLRGGRLLGAAVGKLGVTYGPYLGVRCLAPATRPATGSGSTSSSSGPRPRWSP